MLVETYRYSPRLGRYSRLGQTFNRTNVRVGAVDLSGDGRTLAAHFVRFFDDRRNRFVQGHVQAYSLVDKK